MAEGAVALGAAEGFEGSEEDVLAAGDVAEQVLGFDVGPGEFVAELLDGGAAFGIAAVGAIVDARFEEIDFDEAGAVESPLGLRELFDEDGFVVVGGVVCFEESSEELVEVVLGF
jgi:hypothetical protein